MEKPNTNGNQFIKYLISMITIGTVLVSITLFIANKPSREEVDSIVNGKVQQRFDRIEKQLDNVETDIKKLLERKN